jgi:hypothetical protein
VTICTKPVTIWGGVAKKGELCHSAIRVHKTTNTASVNKLSPTVFILPVELVAINVSRYRSIACRVASRGSHPAEGVGEKVKSLFHVAKIFH